MADDQNLHRAFFIERLRQGLPIGAAIEQLAEESPETLVDLSIGEMSIGSDPFMLLVLPFVELLEGYVPSKALYLRMLNLYPILESHIFDLALSRHPKADWILELISKARDPIQIARAHLLGLGGQLQEYWLEKYIEQSFMEPVWAVAQEGDDRPVHMLLDRNRFEEGAVGAAYVLDIAPECGLVENICSKYGPDIGPWALRVHAELEKIGSAEKHDFIVKWYSGIRLDLDEKN